MSALPPSPLPPATPSPLAVSTLTVSVMHCALWGPFTQSPTDGHLECCSEHGARSSSQTALLDFLREILSWKSGHGVGLVLILRAISTLLAIVPAPIYNPPTYNL